MESHLSHFNFNIWEAWRETFRFLGLDYTRPLWELMGFSIADKMKSQLQSFCREGYTQCEQIYDNRSLDHAPKLVDAILKKIATTLGDEVAAELKVWYEKYMRFLYNDDDGLMMTWDKLLAEMGMYHPCRPDKTNVLGWKNDRYGYLIDLIREKLAIPGLKLDEVIEQFEDALDDTKLSEWDARIFAEERQEFGDILIFAFIDEIGLNFNLSQFWDVLEQELSPMEIRTLSTWLQSESKKKSIPSILAGRIRQRA